MARIRTIKPGFFTSLTIAALPLSARITFIGLWTYADDEGRGIDDPRLVKAEVWPLDDGMSVKKVDRDLSRLADAGLIIRYCTEDRPYLQVTNWGEHQRINRPTPSKHPLPTMEDTVRSHTIAREDSLKAHGAISEPSRQEGKGRERKGTGTPQPPAERGARSRPQVQGCVPDQSGVFVPGTGYVPHVAHTEPW